MSGRWALGGAIAATLGLALAWIVTGSGASPSDNPSTTVADGRFRPDGFTAGAVTAWVAGGDARAVPPVEPSPAQMQSQARLYADCQEADARHVQGVLSALDESYAVDPSGILASAYRAAEQRRIDQCRQVGTSEYRQIEPLMQEAARRGEPNARLFLIEQHLRRLTERAAEALALGETDLTADAARTAQAQSRVQELEQLALQGWVPAMKILAAGPLSSDPLRTAAWNLVASRPPGDQRPLTGQDLEASGSLTPLSPEDSALVLSQAQQLRLACCQAPAP